jgi:hypothetical protein
MAPARRLSSSRKAFMVSSYSRWKGRPSTLLIANESKGHYLVGAVSGGIHSFGGYFLCRRILH